MSATDLPTLLATMSPHQLSGTYVFVVTDSAASLGLEVLASVREPEGLTVVTTIADADRAGLRYTFKAAWITLAVRSDLAAVGLTAAPARRPRHA